MSRRGHSYPRTTEESNLQTWSNGAVMRLYYAMRGCTGWVGGGGVTRNILSSRIFLAKEAKYQGQTVFH